MKKLLVLFLCLLMAGSCLLVSCNDGTQDTNKSDTEDTSKTEAGYDPESGRYVANLPAFEWNVKDSVYATFDVAVTSNEEQSTYFSEDIGFDKYATTDAVINDAVKERNRLIEKKTGVVVTPVYVKNVTTAVQDDIAGGLGNYDMAMPFLSGAITLAQEGQLHALNSEKLSPYIDLTMPWWSQGANEAFSISEQLYFSTGDITIMSKISTRALVFNKEMYATLFPGEKSLYEMVEEGVWTYDKMLEMCKKATVDNGDGKWDYNDTWGLVSETSDPYNFYSAAGESLANKDADDLPYLTFENTRSIDVAQRLLEEYAKKNTWHICSNRLDVDYGVPASELWVVSLDIFGEGRALFRCSVFSAIKKLRNYEDGIEFGIIPLPKFDEDQENYYTPSGAGTYVAVIPITAKDPEYSAYMTELLACEAKNYLTPAYYETTLKSRDARDDESEKMLDEYIFSNLKFDVGSFYNFGGIGSMMQTLAYQGKTDLVSTFEGLKATAENAIDETIENYRN
ncbi:MAG: hypothetical protein IKC06_00860 [Clostridia bacterium]|nr:hypothetical protein [Clostridia bacterium]